MPRFSRLFGGCKKRRKLKQACASFLDELDSLVDLTSREDYLENPIDAFDFIRRRTTTWKEVETIMNCDECELNPPRKNERGDFYAEISWLEQLMASLKEDEDLCSDTVLRKRAVNMLTSAYTRYGMPWKSVDLLANELQKEYSKSVERDLKYYSLKVQDAEKSSKNITLQDSLTPRVSHSMTLCRGEGIRDVSVTSRLYCLYRQVTTPYHRVKEEILNFKPRLSLLYNVISDEEVEQFKELAVIRVLNYGIGGMYVDHHDYLETPLLSFGPLPEEQSQGYPLHDLLCGERTATWIYYLSDVQAGGNTIFTLLNITVPVVKGGAAFWYNIDRAGVHDHWTEHAGCPVLIGSKWISNKWIRETGQVLKRTCGKHMDALDGPL
ncbi:P4HA1-like protein [Mya arenaria]|uniref:procollagen-proline 4-dioxygenase n=1 Tax=Mya arenaria TaxID=6604 RepID=A0ABY7DHF7_MYAAR|nr:P4HA1-like protein [Mya arenaria]